MGEGREGEVGSARGREGKREGARLDIGTEHAYMISKCFLHFPYCLFSSSLPTDIHKHDNHDNKRRVFRGARRSARTHLGRIWPQTTATATAAAVPVNPVGKEK